MAVAAYGSLVSLLNVLDNVHYRAQIRNIHVDINLIESLQDGINCLVEYVEVHSEKEGVVDLCRQLSRMAFEAEEMFDLHVVDQLQLKSQGQKGDLGFLAFNEDVERVIKQVDLIKKDLLVVKEVLEDVQNGKQPRIAALAGDSSSIPFSSGKSTMVGFDDHLRQIMDRLTSDQRHRQIIPIVGMGGIGKTTLARNVFNNALIVEHFDLRIWLTISQEYSGHQILLGLLNDGVVKDVVGNFHEIGGNLYKKLYGRRYLIVMDDVWGIEAWNDLRVFFPNNNNRSRIMMTTRLADLATSLGCEDSYVVTFLDDDKSWNLFCQTTFAQESCPYPEFEEIGRSIAGSCKGLPLEIVVIGSHLANSDMTKESWEFVAENLKSFGDIDDYQHCMEVLYLSYKKLPVHLKLCFLYMRAFREDAEIDLQDLIEQWIAEGYIKPNNGKDLLEIGKKYLKDLTARNLIGRSNEFLQLSIREEHEKALHVHDLFRDLCIREWKKEQYICSPKIQIFELIPSNVQDACFHCGTLHIDAGAKNILNSVVISPTTSNETFVICRDCEVMYSEIKRPRLVKVASVQNDSFIKELVHPTQLRYAMARVRSCLIEYVSPCMLQLLWNLQNLVFSSSHGSPMVLPPQIWELPQLRRIESIGRQYFVLPNPAATLDAGEDFVILKNIWSLIQVCNLECTNEILNRIPNLKYLMIKYEQELEDMQRLHNSLCNLTHLQKLERLFITDAALEHAIFPKSLKYLTLRRCKISWKDFTIAIGSLPSLEGLSLMKSGEGPDWTPVDGEFLQLKVLQLVSCDLRCWNVDQDHFPKLEGFWLKGPTLLEKVPSGMGDIATLQLINIADCNEDVNESAKKIWEEQQSMGNESLQIVIDDEKYLGEDEI